MHNKVAIFITGSPLSGKSKLGSTYVSRNGGAYASTGDIMRILSESNSKIAEDLKNGNLGSDETHMRLTLTSMLSSDDKIVVIDGFPRYAEQMAWLIEQCFSIDRQFFVVMLDIPPDEIKKRANHRDRKDDSISVLNKRLGLFSVYKSEILNEFALYDRLICFDDIMSINSLIWHIEDKLTTLYRRNIVLDNVRVQKKNRQRWAYDYKKIFHDLQRANRDRRMVREHLTLPDHKIWLAVDAVNSAISDWAHRFWKVGDDEPVLATSLITRMISIRLSEMVVNHPEFAPLARSWFLYSEVHRRAADDNIKQFLEILKE